MDVIDLRNKNDKPPTPPPASPPPSPRPTVGHEQEDTHQRRQLNVKDALTYLDQVKLQFQDLPDVYNQFLDIMKEFKNEQIATPAVIRHTSQLFHGHPSLIQGLNAFLPAGYSVDALSETGLVTITTPEGTTSMQTTPPLS